MINDNTTFYSYIGQIIMFCQKIEHDVKLLSAGLSPHGFEVGKKVFEEDKTTLGQALTMLQDFDNLQKNRYLSNEDYKLLWKVNSTRNYYAHQCFQDLLYIPNDDERKAALHRVASRVEEDFHALDILSDKIEKIRISFFKNKK